MLTARITAVFAGLGALSWACGCPQPSPPRAPSQPQGEEKTERVDPPTEAPAPGAPGAAAAGASVCVALATCCAEVDGEAYCRQDVAKDDPLQCALSMYWNDCPDLPRPDVDAGEQCFRTPDGCHASLLAACRAQGCEDKRGPHGCHVTGEDRRDVDCGDW